MKMNFVLFGSSVFALCCTSEKVKEPVCKEAEKPKQAIYEEVEKPNILIIVLDDVGFNKLGFLSGNELTPNLDKLVADGVYYNNAYTSSAVCTPARYSLLTGNFAGRSTHPRFVNFIPKTEPTRINWNTYLSDSDYTIHEALNEDGYFTGFIGKWHLGHILDLEGLVPKIDVNSNPDDVNDSLVVYQKTIVNIVKKLSGANFAQSIIYENNEQNPVKDLKKHQLEWHTKGFYDFIDSIPDNKPFFTYFATTVTHGPSAYDALNSNIAYTSGGKIEGLEKYHPNRSSVLLRGQKFSSTPDNNKIGTVWLDDQIGAIVKKLKESGKYDSTIIFIVTDNNNEPGKATCYEAGVRVPMIVKWTNNKDAGTVSKLPVMLVDIFPTILDLCKIKYDDSMFDGISMFSKRQEQREDLYFEMGITRALKWKNYKYLAFRVQPSDIRDMKDGRIKEATNQMGVWWAGQTYVAMKCYPAYWEQDQLYDLEKDPYEVNNLANDSTYADILAEMKIRLQKYLSTFEYPFPLDYNEYMVSNEFFELVKETEKRMPEMLKKLYLYNIEWPPKNQ